MAESKIPNPNIMPNISTETLSSGTVSVSVISSTQIKLGKIVFTSARISIPNAVTNGMDLPILRLNKFIPSSSTGVTSIARVGSNVFANLIGITRYADGYYYVKQFATSNLSANSTIELFFCYETE